MPALTFVCSSVGPCHIPECKAYMGTGRRLARTCNTHGSWVKLNLGVVVLAHTEVLLLCSHLHKPITSKGENESEFENNFFQV